MRDLLIQMMNTFAKEKTGPFGGNKAMGLYTNDFPQELYKTRLFNETQFKIEGSVGKGVWADASWVCIMDRDITTSVRRGVYIAFLFCADGKAFYMTLNQGMEELKEQHGRKKATEMMREIAAKVVSTIDIYDFESEPQITLGTTERAKMYEKGTVCYKKYSCANMPDDEVLLHDLRNMTDIYAQYKRTFFLKENMTKVETPKLPKENKNNSEKVEKMPNTNRIDQIKLYIKSKGYSYDGGLIENFYLCLKSKPFVILAGTSGTGKTKLVKLFAEAIGAEYKLVPVRPDWSDSSDLFGHANIHGEFVDGAIIEFIENAMIDPDKPYFLCLDEMNLARVEYYFSDFLSLIETRRWDGDEIVTDKIDLGKAGNEKHEDLYIPENLYVIGTVNMDETTYPFSKKVLDRANTIEFSDVDLRPSFAGGMDEVEPQELGNDFLKTKYITLLTDIDDSQKDQVTKVCTELQAINDILKKANAHVGYRVRDEIAFYMLNNDEHQLLKYEEAMDFEIMQKILPRIQGSSQGIKDLLIELFKKCAGDYASFAQDTIWSNMQERLKGKTVYPRSATKICYMMRRFEEDGFTSYWL